MISLNDDYAEFSVKGRDHNGGVLFTFLIVIAVLCGMGAVLYINLFLYSKHLGTLGAIIVIAYILFGIPFLWRLRSKKSTEYDYLYVENDLEICEVYNGSKRKLAITVHLDHAKCIAPLNSPTALEYENVGITKVKDFSEYAEDDDSDEEVERRRTYVIVVEKDGVNVEILIAGDEHMLTLMKYRNKDRFFEA